jgi:hypothetical protein
MAAPTVSAPVDTTIKIDPGALYYYVVPQVGATSATVTPVANWTLAISFGATPVLSVKYTGAIPGSPFSQPVVIHLTNDDGTTNQTLTFEVQNYASRKIPNIITVPATTVAVGTTIALPLAADLKSTWNVIGLPSGLSVTGQNIIGAPRGTAGHYPIILVATNPQTTGKTYRRYWVLNITAPTSASGSLDVTAPNTSGGPSIRVLYDGDYTVAQQAGSAVPVNPIPEDPKPYLYRIKYWQFLANYAPPDPGSAGPNGGYFVGEVPGSFQDVGAGVVEFVREFAFIPDSRQEFESYTYSYQYWQISGGSGSVTEVPMTTLSRVQYDYFHLSSVPQALASLQAAEGAGGGATSLTNGSSGWQGVVGGGSVDHWISGGVGADGASISQISLPKAPRVFQVFNAIYFRNGYGGLVNGEEILAEDATLRRWRGLIFERKQRFVVYINPTEFV